MEPTKDELKNGWTEETLTKYHLERGKQNNSIDLIFKKKPKPSRQVKYNPLRWRNR